MKDIKKRLPEKFFEAFKEECEYWIKELGLISVEIDILKTEKKDEGCRAYTVRTRPTSNRIFAIWLVMWQDKNNSRTYKEIRKCAFHEVWEVLMYDISDAITDSETGHYAASNVHEVIRTLENTLFEDRYNARFSKVEKASARSRQRA